MNTHTHFTERHIPGSARASIAAELARFYSTELGDAAPREEPDTLGRIIYALADPSGAGVSEGHAREVCSAAATLSGRNFDPRNPVIPWSMLANAARDLAKPTASAGGYLVGVDQQPAVDLIAPWSVVARAGVTQLRNLQGDVTIPATSTDLAVTYHTTPAAGPVATAPVLGQSVMTLKTASARVAISRHMLLQAAGLNGYLSALLMRVAGSLIDRAVLAGTGANGQPTGVANSGIGGPSGTSFDAADLLTMQGIALADGTDESRLRFVGGLTAHALLHARAEYSGWRPLWSRGDIDGIPASATTHCPSTTLILADWSRVVLGLWGAGVTLSVNPYENFAAGVISVRVTVDLDVAVPLAGNAGFAIVNDIT